MPDDCRTANLLNALALALGDRLRAAVEDASGHAAVDAAALITAGEYPGDSIAELGRPLGLSHSATVRLVDRLVADGLMERRPGTTDGRAVAVSLTERGHAVANAALLRRRAAVLPLLTQALSAAERDVLADIAEKLLVALTVDSEGLRRICRLCEYRACTRCPVDQAASGERGAPMGERAP